tara:strand:+ start:288 stop:1091 length:804 start_codon:yes stop_codon:yes gene_type:complete
MLINSLKISVVMSVFNHEDYVSDAIESILGQTYQNLEFLIINDGSTDGSLKIILKYSKLDSRIIVINQGNLGLTRSLNIGIRQSSGDYIARQDADDISALNRLEKQLDAIQKYELDIVTTRAFKNNKIVPNRIILSFNNSSILKTGNIFIHGSFFIDRKVFDMQMYDEKFQYAQDFKFILDALFNNLKIGVMIESLYYLNNIYTSISNTKKIEQNEYSSVAISNFFGSNIYFKFISKSNRHFYKFIKISIIIILFFTTKGHKFKIIK